MFSSPYYSMDKMKDFMPTFKPCRNRPDLARKKEQGRNEKCACKSGLKYKKCCGK